jgi:hypothetical protein
MDAATTRITGRAWLAAAGLALLLAPICARADESPNDRHEIPTFVLKRTELATDTDAAARIAAGATAADAAFPGVTR